MIPKWINWIGRHKYKLVSIGLILGIGTPNVIQYLDLYGLFEEDWEYPENVADLTVENSADWASNWLIRSVRSDGSFKYMYYLETNTYSSEYSYLRHWGTVYSMIYYYNMNPQPEMLTAVRETINWGLKYFNIFDNDSSIGYLYYQQTSTAGGPALALMALTEYQSATGDTRYNSYMTKLGNLLLWMQQPNGKIRSYYIFRGNASYGKDTPFYPAESLLALTLLYKLTDNVEYLHAMERAYDYYSDLANFDYYAGENTPFIPWASSAFAELYLLTENKTYADFAFNLVDFRLQSQTTQEYYDDYGNNVLGSISKSVAVSSTMEGLGDTYAAAVHLNDTARMSNYEYSMKIGVEWLLILQMRYDECEALGFEKPGRAFGGFRHSFIYDDALTMRNDYAQHSLSAFIKYLTYFPDSLVNETEFRVPKV
ncbi:MAG: hypothetical protein ACTSVZ_05960 [Promethearchaeota archaeon]